MYSGTDQHNAVNHSWLKPSCRELLKLRVCVFAVKTGNAHSLKLIDRLLHRDALCFHHFVNVNSKRRDVGVFLFIAAFAAAGNSSNYRKRGSGLRE
jgi:hypothetical protein